MGSSIIGIDPGTIKCGWGSMIGGKNHVGLIQISPEMPMHYRLYHLFWNLNKIFHMVKPTHVAMEKSYVGKNRTVVIALSRAQGVVMTLAGMFNAKMLAYTASNVKKTVTGDGRASKDDVIRKVKRLGKFRNRMDDNEAVLFGLGQ